MTERSVPWSSSCRPGFVARLLEKLFSKCTWLHCVFIVESVRGVCVYVY